MPSGVIFRYKKKREKDCISQPSTREKYTKGFLSLCANGCTVPFLSKWSGHGSGIGLGDPEMKTRRKKVWYWLYLRKRNQLHHIVPCDLEMIYLSIRSDGKLFVYHLQQISLPNRRQVAIIDHDPEHSAKIIEQNNKNTTDTAVIQTILWIIRWQAEHLTRMMDDMAKIIFRVYFCLPPNQIHPDDQRKTTLPKSTRPNTDLMLTKSRWNIVCIETFCVRPMHNYTGTKSTRQNENLETFTDRNTDNTSINQGIITVHFVSLQKTKEQRWWTHYR